MPYIGKQPTIGEFVELDALTASATADYALTRNGAAYYPETVNNLLVSINGVIQAGSTMSLSGNTLTVGATLSSSDVIDFVRVFGNVGNVVTPTDGSVTDVKIDSMSASKLTGALPASSFPSGAIIQTQVHQEDGLTYWAYAASAGSDRLLLAADANDSTSHLSVNITPTSATSKILLTTSVFFEGEATNAQDYLWSFYRDSTKLGQANAVNRRGGIMATSTGSFTGDASSTADSASYSYYDTPNTTSAITYAVAFNFSSNSGNLFLNRTVNDVDSVSYERGVSIIIAQEIAQ